MDLLDRTLTTCLPWWHTRFANAAGRTDVVKSGCSTVNGNVQCAPKDMAAKSGVDLSTYTLARYFSSEVGSGTVEEKVAVAEAAINQSKNLPQGILSLLLYRQPVGHPNRGFYGPIHGDAFPEAPYGRWAATSRDPTVGDLEIAAFVLGGGTNHFARGADDQDGIGYTQAFPDPAATIRRKAKEHNYWVGPLPGVNHWNTFLWTHRPDISPIRAALLIKRGLDAVSNRNRPNWSNLPVCSIEETAASMIEEDIGKTVFKTVLGFVVGAGVGYWAGRALRHRHAGIPVF